MISKEFLMVFAEEFVEVLTTVNNTYSEDSKNGFFQTTAPYITDGFLIAVDDVFIYLGDTSLEVKKAIRIDTIVQIEKLNDLDKKDARIDSFDVPNKKTDIN